MSTVLITGGTGLVGKALSHALLAKGYEIIILSRGQKNKEVQPGISYARWDIKKQYIDVSAIQKADHIVHLAGAGVVEKKWTEAYKKEIRASRIESSRLIIEALRNNENKVKTVVSSSAIGWYGEDTEPVKPFVEGDPPADNFLGQTCKLWEESIEPVTGLGKRLVKFRTGIVLGNEGGAYAEFKKPVHLGIAPVLGSGRQVVSWIHIDDLCRMFIAAIENENMHGSYNAVASLPVTNRQLMLTIANTIKGKFYIPVQVPSFVLKIMLGDRSIEILKSATVSNKKILDTGFRLHFENIEDAIKNLEKNN
jgi:uncharacterized protein